MKELAAFGASRRNQSISLYITGLVVADDPAVPLVRRSSSGGVKSHLVQPLFTPDVYAMAKKKAKARGIDKLPVYIRLLIDHDPVARREIPWEAAPAPVMEQGELELGAVSGW